jgi:signal transduction histidine kinase
MLNALMDISEAETGVMKLTSEQVKLCSLVAEVVDVYGYVAEEKNLKIEVSVPEDIVLSADRARIRQVFANLLDNSIKYTSEGGVKIIARREGDQVAVSFEDTGEGISREDIPHIFDRLYRCDRSRSQRGLGLGLSFVKAVLKAHSGRIELQSELNQGSKVTIFLPASQGG